VDGPAATGRLAENVVHFARILRKAGLPIGPGRSLDALRAAEAVGLARRDDLRAALAASLLTRHDQRALFYEAFDIFWRDPALEARMTGMLLPAVRVPGSEEEPPVTTRLAEAFAAEKRSEPPPPEREVEIDMALAPSDEEVLRTKDFEQMTVAELAMARQAIQKLHLAFPPVRTRRTKPGRRGHILDGRGSLRATARTGGESLQLRYRETLERPAPIVVLCDISGSMARYSRILLHFVHGLSNDRDRVSTFLFGTRLTNITRQLRQRDVDVAVEQASATAFDWAGGTRIAHCLAEFNKRWSRRVLGHGAVVLLITDGLDREGGAGLAAEAMRLARSCQRIIWLNPLLRFEGFQPKSLGIKALLPYVDEFRPVHNLASLNDLAAALAAPQRRGVRRSGRSSFEVMQ
jgi:uncharacterized protein